MPKTLDEGTFDVYLPSARSFLELKVIGNYYNAKTIKFTRAQSNCIRSGVPLAVIAYDRRRDEYFFLAKNKVRIGGRSRPYRKYPQIEFRGDDYSWKNNEPWRFYGRSSEKHDPSVKPLRPAVVSKLLTLV